MKKLLLLIFLILLQLSAIYAQQYLKSYTTPEQQNEFRQIGQMPNDSVDLGLKRHFNLYKESGRLVHLYFCNRYINATVKYNRPFNPDLFEELRSIARQRGDTLTEEFAATYAEEALYYFYHEQRQKSQDINAIAYRILKKVKLEQPLDMVGIAYRLGFIYETMGNYEQALKWTSRCLSDAQQYKTPIYEVGTYIILSRMTINMGTTLAVDFAHKGLSIIYSEPNNFGRSKELLFDLLAIAYTNYLHDYPLALQYSDSLIQIVGHDSRKNMNLLGYLRMKALAHYKLDQVDESNKVLQLMDSIVGLDAVQSHPSFFSYITDYMGYAYFMTNHYNKAKLCCEKGIAEYTQKGYDRYHDEYLLINDMLMRTLIKLGEFSYCDSLYRQVYPYSTRNEPIDSLLYKYNQQQLDKLFDFVNRRFDIIVENPNGNWAPDTLLAIYETAYKIINAKFIRGDFNSRQINDDLKLLKAFLDDFINKRIVDRMTPEQMDKFWLISSAIKSYELVNAKLSRQMGTLDAPLYRKMKSRLGKTPKNDPNYKAYFDEYIAYVRDSLVRNLVRKNNPYNPDLLQNSYQRTSELLERAGSNLIVDLYQTDSLIAAFAIHGGELHYHSIVLSKAVRDALLRLNGDIKTMSYLSNPAFSFIEKELLQLLSGFEDVQKINFIADGELLMFPFELLRSNNQYLIEQYEISYSYSPFLLNESIRTTKHSVNRLLALAPLYNGNSTIAAQGLRDDIAEFDSGELYDDLYRNNSLVSLPYTRDEVKGIESLFSKKKGTVRVLIGDEATKKALNQGVNGFDVIHFATHGYCSTKNPSLSRLVLATDNKNVSTNDAEAFLYLDETYDLNLNADLVVLSACKTGTGKILEGEGVMALPRGFIYAGVPNVIASLWKVHDEKTKDLMLAFYEHLLNDNVSYAEALRRAKLDCIKKGFLPLDWAGFILIGE